MGGQIGSFLVTGTVCMSAHLLECQCSLYFRFRLCWQEFKELKNKSRRRTAIDLRHSFVSPTILEMRCDWLVCIRVYFYQCSGRLRGYSGNISEQRLPSFCRSSELRRANGNSTGTACRKQAKVWVKSENKKNLS